MKMAGLGSKGAIYSLIIGEFIGNIVSRIFAYRILKVSFNYSLFLHILVSFSTMFMIDYLLKLLVINNIVLLIVFGIIGALIYVFIMFLVGDINNSDFKLLNKLIKSS